MVFAETLLPELVAEALARNPEIRAAEARWRMFEHKVLPSRSLNDPQLTIAFSNYPVDSFNADDTPMTGNDVKIAQKFPYPGKLGLKGEVAETEAEWYRAAYEETRLKVRFGLKDVYYRLFQQDKAIAIVEKNLRLLDDTIRLAETRYEVGQGLQQDVLKAQVERSKLMDSLFTLRQGREEALAALNAILDRPAGSSQSGLPEAGLTPFDFTLAGLQEQAEESRPMFAAYRSLLERFEAKEKLARLDYKPDLTVFAGYRFRDDGLADGGTDFASAGVTINLPIFGEKRSEAVAEARAGSRMARRQLEDFRGKVAANLHSAFARKERSRDQAMLYKTGLVPQASQAFQASMSAYQVGKVDFLNVLNSLLGLYRYEIDYFRAVAEYQRSLARIEYEAGLNRARIQQSYQNNDPKER
ncbi:TolC family protein [Desulfuromonas sp.]|uniref:TolC family protein n=1 Tax=Desulfuromonas sp. TaxID=892 RepID=UPI0025C24C4E|nr:TolC family protein [Desulfuromonas sp.]